MGKRVQFMIVGTKATAVFDDTLPQEKLLIFDMSKPGHSERIPVDYLEIEPLKLECQHFINCIENGYKARSDGENGYTVVKILQQAEEIMLGDKAKKLDNIQYSYSRRKK